MMSALVLRRFSPFFIFALLCALAVALVGFSGSTQASSSTEPDFVGPVTNVAASTDGQEAGAVRLTWTAAENAQVHFVAYLKSADLDAGNYGGVRMAPFSGSAGVISGLEGGASYVFLVIGMRWNWIDYGTVWGDWSQRISATALGPPLETPDTTLPSTEPDFVGPVANLAASTDGQEAGAVRLTWTAAENAQVHFVAYLKSADLDAGNYSGIRMAPFSGTEGVISGLEGGASCVFLVIGMRWNWIDYGTVWGDWSQRIYATSAPTTPVSGAIAIPDPLLRSAIEGALGKTPDDPITAEEMATLKELYGGQSSSLEGLQYATNLTRLGLNSGSPSLTSLTDLSPLSGLTELTYLAIIYSHISDLSPLSDLAQLTELNLFYSNISDISPLVGLTELTLLSLSHGHIWDLSPLAGLTELTFLNLSNNNISDLSPLVANTGLGRGDEISVDDNPLDDASINTDIPALRARGIDFGDGVVEHCDPDGDHYIHNGNVFVMPVPENLVADDLLLRYYTACFYQHFEDEFDFLMLLSNLHVDEGVEASGYYGIYNHVKNDVEGIGNRNYTYNDQWGAGEKLQGVIHFPYYEAIQSGPSLHELMHRWANYVIPSPFGSHWGFSSANGQLGGFDIDNLVDHGNGRYSAGRFGPNANGGNSVPYSPIELYMAGFIPPEEVPDLLVAEEVELLEFPMFSASGFTTYTIEDIIAKHGRRVPDYSQAQRDFRAAAILLINEQHPATDEILDLVSSEVAWFSQPDGGSVGGLYNFYFGTGGRAMITMDGLSQFQKTPAQ